MKWKRTAETKVLLTREAGQSADGNEALGADLVSSSSPWQLQQAPQHTLPWGSCRRFTWLMGIERADLEL